MQKHVFFDLDSTLAKIEGLDYLAASRGLGARLTEITMQAMNGKLPMQDAMAAKLRAIRPNREELVDLAAVYLANLTQGTKETLCELEKHGFKVWIISGNFHPAASIVAQHLGVHPDRVLANKLIFHHDGQYRNFDLHQPLVQNGGKTILIRRHTKLSDLVFMVGDGATDLETQGTVDLFIGFGGVVRRENVAQNAQIYVEDLDLRAVIPHILNFQKSKVMKNKLQ